VANHKSSKKRILVTIKKNAINTARRSAVKTETKKALAAIASGDKAAATTAVRNAESKIMKAAGKVCLKNALRARFLVWSKNCPRLHKPFRNTKFTPRPRGVFLFHRFSSGHSPSL